MNSTIKRIANEAKKRLKNGYWEELYKNRDEDLKIAQEKGVASGFIVDAYKQKMNSAVYSKQNILPNEKDLYNKVYDIVLREIDGKTVYNPIGILKDDNYYNTLDDTGKQKYIFDLSKVYIDLRLKIEREFKIRSLKE